MQKQGNWNICQYMQKIIIASKAGQLNCSSPAEKSSCRTGLTKWGERTSKGSFVMFEHTPLQLHFNTHKCNCNGLCTDILAYLQYLAHQANNLLKFQLIPRQQ